MGALMQATAGTGLFKNAPWRRAMGDVGLIPGYSYGLDSSGDAVATNPATKGIFIDLQNQTNRLCAYYGFGDLMLQVDGIIGPNTVAAVAAVLGMLAQAGDVSGLEGSASNIDTLAGMAASVAPYFEAQASALGAPSVSAPPVARAGGGSGAAPAPATAVAKNNTVRTPIMIAGIDISDPTTLAVIAAAGIGAYLIGKKNKRGGGRRRAPRRRARARRRPRARARRRGRR